MRRVSSDEELERLHHTGKGLIYNDFPAKEISGELQRVLHAAHCRWISKSNANMPKYFFLNTEEAVQWLKANRGKENEDWRRCKSCDAQADSA